MKPMSPSGVNPTPRRGEPADGIRALLRRIGLGRLLYGVYHRPLGGFSELRKAGGPWEALRTARGRSEMEEAARLLAPIPAASGSTPLVVHVLTGSRFWYQTAFCLHTLSTHARRAVSPVIYDDGSLLPRQATALRRIFPATRIVSQGEATSRLDAFLPRNRFPALRDRWDHYPNIRKLIDPHLNSHGWKLVIDSDILFFREPGFLTSWCDDPRMALHSVDVANSYGYSPGLLRQLSGTTLPDLVNVGLCGLDSDAFDWTQVERWCRTLIDREGHNYYLEQALVAMMVAGRPCSIAPADDYVTLPRPPEALECRSVMHHYVAESKRWYFQRNWRRASAGNPP
jgi:hypothetical protein